jgi:hypothetical protein
MFETQTIKEALDPFKNQGTEHPNAWSMQMIMFHSMDYEGRGFMGAW